MVTGGADNSKKFPEQQISYLGKVATCITIFPYGFYANASSNKDTLATFFSVDGDEENRIAIPWSGEKRPRDLDEGEVSLYHPNTETFIKLRNNGDLEITTGNGASGNVVINCSDASITGDVTVNGDLTVTGDTTLGTMVTSGGTNIGATHVHSGVTSGGSNSGPPV